jgi:hypothetical protein
LETESVSMSLNSKNEMRSRSCAWERFVYHLLNICIQAWTVELPDANRLFVA